MAAKNGPTHGPLISCLPTLRPLGGPVVAGWPIAFIPHAIFISAVLRSNEQVNEYSMCT